MKSSKGFGLLGVIIIIVCTAIVSSVATGVIMLNRNSAIINGNKIDLTKDTDLQEFINVYETLLSKYYDKVDKKGMLNAAEEGMLNYLDDKYTTYLNDYEYNSIINELSGMYNGIGISISENKVVGVTEDSPAAKAGIKEEDLLVKVNGTDVTEMTSREIGELIKGNDVEEVTIEIKRGEELLTFRVKKTDLVYPSISYKKLDNTNIGYMYISNFSQNLSEQVNKALNEMESDGIESLIIDVRDNVGGYLSAAESTASIFLEKGKVIYSLESNDKNYTYKDETESAKKYKIIVLINENSASASEILAAALKESYGATLVGKKSYGKGKVQQVVALTGGGSVKYTSAKWLTPSGVCIDEIGINPDYEVEYEVTDLYDTQVDKAIELLS